MIIEADDRENYINSEGVVLSIKPFDEKVLYAGLFIRDYGIITATLPHFSPQKKSISRELQQFSRGNFELIQKKKGSKYYIKNINIISDSSAINMNKEALYAALRWTDMLPRYLIHRHADNELFAIFLDSIKLLESSHIVPASAAEFRFIWLWLEEWGLAPDLIDFYGKKNFNDDEIILLTQIQSLDSANVIKLFSLPVSKNIRRNSFKIASELALNFFHQI